MKHYNTSIVHLFVLCLSPQSEISFSSSSRVPPFFLLKDSSSTSLTSLHPESLPHEKKCVYKKFGQLQDVESERGEERAENNIDS